MTNGESGQVLYRRWRPRDFAGVVGQAAVTTTLRNAVASGAPAHAYLFTGPRGTGKTSAGRIMAKAVNCESPVEGEPDNTCASCEMYNTGRALDLIELDAASNRGIDEIRDLRESAGYAPTSGRFKVYLVDEVHMLTDAAFNALLKTLEEPPPHVIFILATTEAHRIPATITSRCQRFDFRRHRMDDLVGLLQTIAEGESVTVEEGGFELIAREATGSARDAVNLLDQLIAYRGRDLTLDAVQAGLGLVVDERATELAAAAVRRDLAAGLTVLAAARDDGIEIRAFAREVVSTLRSMLLLRAGSEQLPISDAQHEELSSIAKEVTVDDIVQALRAFGGLDFAGDAYDALPAEIAFASLVVTDAQPSTAAAAPPDVPPAEPARRETPAAQPAPSRQQQPRAQQRSSTPPPVQPTAPRPAARPAAASGGGAASRPFTPPDEGPVSPELAELREHWDQIRSAAREAHVKAGALLNAAYPRSVEGDRVEIGFRFPPHVDLVLNSESGAVLTAITQAVSTAAGRSVEVVPVHWEALASTGPAPAAQSSGGHLLDEAMKQGAVKIDD